MSLFKIPTKNQLAQLLDEAQIRDAIVEHQKQNASWATSKTRTKEALVGVASLKTLLKAALKMYEDQKNLTNINDLRRHISTLEEGSKPSASSSTTAEPKEQSNSDLSKKQLQTHLQILVSAGLMTKGEAEKYNDFWTLCPSDRQAEGSKAVYDAMNLEVFDETKGDIVRLSDNRCYSKSALIDFIKSGTVSIETGQIVLPLSSQPIQDVDYDVLQIEKPSRAARRLARDTQSMLSAQQLWQGDIEKWRAGRARPEHSFAYYITDEQERQQLASELGVRLSELAQPDVEASRPAIVAAPAVPPRASVVIPKRKQPKQPVLVAGAKKNYVIMENGDVYDWDVLQQNLALIGVTQGKKIISVASIKNGLEAFFLTENGDVINSLNNLAEFNNGKKFTTIGGTTTSLYGLTENGTVVGFQDNLNLETSLRLAANGQKIVDISAGPTHLLAILENGSVIGVGDDKEGKATEAHRSYLTRKFVAISAGANHSLGILDNGTVVGWGKNNYDQATGGQPLMNSRSLQDRKKFIDVAAGKTACSVGLVADGSILIWGQCSSYESELRGKNIRAIAADRTILAMLDDGKTIIEYSPIGNSFQTITAPDNLKFKTQT